MATILPEIFRSLKDLGIAAIVFIAWKTANDSSEGGKYKTVLWEGFLWCAGIAFILSINLGNPTCIDSDSGPYGSTCNEYADDSYVATTEQKAGNFAYIMTLLYIPVVIGALKNK